MCTVLFFRNVLFPLWEERVRQRLSVSRWRELQRTQWLSADELVASNRSR